MVTPPVAPTNEKVGGSAIGSLDTDRRWWSPRLRDLHDRRTLQFHRRHLADHGDEREPGGPDLQFADWHQADGKGLQFSIAGDPNVERIVTLYLGGFQATSNLTLTLDGIAQPITDSKVFGTANPKQLDVYTLRFRPDSAADLLLMQYTASAITDATNGHVGLQAVTVAAVPEPGAASLLCLGGLALSAAAGVRPHDCALFCAMISSTLR